ncbi:hornerin-like [Nasonia vitripennis]|uniref:Uncharacterized protein n=1 Tax=Nasonia vitripennis TaxID=7425 RepID=A0A7M7LIS2_NASVI|nr:hornerin-like [Nasonia vitripennis]
MAASSAIWMNGLAALLLALLLPLDDSRGAMARPAGYDDYLTLEGAGADMLTVGSLRREVRQPAPAQQQRIATEVSDLLSLGNEPKKSHEQHRKKHAKNASGKSDEGGFYKSYGSDADGEKGYLKKTYSKGDHGYKSLDTFHKKLGDRYGFEEHEAFGKESDKDEGKHHGKSASQKRKHSDDHEGAGTDDVSHYADEGDSSTYSEGDGSGENYGDGESSSYNDGGSEGYSESYSSGDGDSYGSGESYSSDGGSSGEGGDYY